MPLPNDPVGAGPDMSQWQNWLMNTLQPPAQPGADALGSSLVAHPGAPPWWRQPSGVTSSGDILNPTPEASPAAAQFSGRGIGGDWRYPMAPAGGQGGVGSDARFPLANASPAGTSTAAPAAPAAVPGSPAARGINLGYYRPMTGNARQAQWIGPNDPGNAFRGPLAAPPAAQTIPPTATASVPPAAPITARPDLAQRMPQDQWPQPPVRPTGWPFNQ